MKHGLKAICRNFHWFTLLGYLGQFFAFFAVVLPIFFSRGEEVTLLVVVSAVSGIVSQVILYGFQSLGIVLAKSQVVCGLQVSLLLFCALLLISFPLFVFVRPELFLSYLSAVFLTVSLTSYQIVFTLLERFRDYIRLGFLRLSYGFFSLFFVAFLINMDFVQSLVIAAFLSYFLSSAGVILSSRDCRSYFVSAFRLPGISALVVYISQHFRAGMASSFAAFAAQLSALITPFLGIYKIPWAFVLRIQGGVGTVLQQLILPRFEGEIAFSIRSHSHNTYRLICNSLRSSSIFAFLGIILCFATVSIFTRLNQAISIQHLGVFYFVVLLFVGVSLVVTAFQKSLIMFGLDRIQLYIYIFKLIALILLLVVFHFTGLNFLLIFTFLELVSDFSIIFCVLRYSRAD